MRLRPGIVGSRGDFRSWFLSVKERCKIIMNQSWELYQFQALAPILLGEEPMVEMLSGRHGPEDGGERNLVASSEGEFRFAVLSVSGCTECFVLFFPALIHRLRCEPLTTTKQFCICYELRATIVPEWINREFRNLRFYG